MIFGCENGALMFHGDEFVGFTAPDEYGRMGNTFVSETSSIVVSDYKSDPDAEGYLLNAVTLIDTAARTFEVVDLPDEVQYTVRDIARGSAMCCGSARSSRTNCAEAARQLSATPRTRCPRRARRA